MTDAPFTTKRHEMAGGRLRLELHGELDYATAPFARRAVAAAQTTTPELVIDLSGIEKADVFASPSSSKPGTPDPATAAPSAPSGRPARSRAPGAPPTCARSAAWRRRATQRLPSGSGASSPRRTAPGRRGAARPR